MITCSYLLEAVIGYIDLSSLLKALLYLMPSSYIMASVVWRAYIYIATHPLSQPRLLSGIIQSLNFPKSQPQPQLTKVDEICALCMLPFPTHEPPAFSRSVPSGRLPLALHPTICRPAVGAAQHFSDFRVRLQHEYDVIQCRCKTLYGCCSQAKAKLPILTVNDTSQQVVRSLHLAHRT